MALHAASYYGNTANVRLLLELGGEVNLVGGRFGTPLQVAATKGHTDVMAALLDAGAAIDEHKVGCYGSALIAAIVNKEDKAMKMLLDRGVDLALRAGLRY